MQCLKCMFMIGGDVPVILDVKETSVPKCEDNRHPVLQGIWTFLIMFITKI